MKDAVNQHNKATIREITEYSELLDIKEEWDQLLSARQRPSVFLTPEWIDAAWQWRQEDNDLRLMCSYRDEKLQAIAPFCVSRTGKSAASGRQLTLIEVPDTQECDLVTPANHAQTATADLLTYLGTLRDWDVAVLPKIEPDSCLAQHIASACDQVNMRWAQTDAGDNLEVDLTEDWDTYYAARSRRLRGSNNNCRNKIHADGNNVRMSWSGQEDDGTDVSEDILEKFKHISSISWKKETGLTLDQSGPQRFIDRITQHAFGKKWLSLWLLEINDAVVATEYQLAYHGVIVALRADFDPAFSKMSPGSYLNWQILETLSATDNTLYRMGPGSNPYKLRWTNRATPLKEIRLYNRTLRGQYLWFLETLAKPALRRLAAIMRQSADSLKRIANRKKG